MKLTFIFNLFMKMWIVYFASRLFLYSTFPVRVHVTHVYIVFYSSKTVKTESIHWSDELDGK